MVSEADVRSAANSGDGKKAMRLALDGKEYSFASIAFSALKEADHAAMVESLNEDDVDLLMLWVYRAMGDAHPTCGTLLKLHAALVNKGGLGSITRVLCTKDN
jgi:hypothetical protein